MAYVFWPIRLKFFMGTQETISYRLVMRNHSFGPYLPFSIFWALRSSKMGVAPLPICMGRGFQNPTKKLTHWLDLLGTPLSRNLVSDFFGGPTPAPLKKANFLLNFDFFNFLLKSNQCIISTVFSQIRYNSPKNR